MSFRGTPKYIEVKEVAINGTNLVDCRKILLAGPGTDLETSGSATSDQRTEADATAGWTGSDAAVSSVTTHGGVTPFAGTHFLRILGDAGDGVTVGEARKTITTVVGKKYRRRSRVWQLATNTDSTAVIKIGTTAGGAEVLTTPIPFYPGWNDIEYEFVATNTTTHIAYYGVLDTESMYVDDSSTVLATTPAKYLYPKGFVVVAEWADGSEFLKITPPDGVEYSLSNAASKAFQIDLEYNLALAFFRSSGGTESAFKILLQY